MAQRGPLVTAVVAVGGLVGLMTANAAGGLVTAAGPTPSPTRVGATQSEQPPTTTAPPLETTTAPPVETTTAPPPAEQEQGQDGPVFPAEAVYTGRADDIPLAIAIAVKGEEASAYLCDGKNVETWLKGTAEDGTVELASADGAATLTASLQGDELAGTVTLAGEPHDFTVVFAPPPAGLYRGEDGQTTVGWIILPDGTQVGIARTPSGSRPAPPLNPGRGGVTLDGEFVAAEKVTGETTFG